MAEKKKISGLQYRNLSDLTKLPNNPRQIKDESFKKLCQSIKDNPDYFEARPLILSDRTGELIILAGNQRYDAAMEVGLTEVPTFLISGLTEKREREITIRDNVANGEWNYDILQTDYDFKLLNDWGVDVPWEGDLEIGLEEFEERKHKKLTDSFLVPPFSILDTRQGYWQERKAAWRELIGDAGESRGGILRTNLSGADPSYYIKKEKAEKKLGRRLTNKEYEEKYYEVTDGQSKVVLSGVSVLDPVLSEVVNHWFNIKDGKAFDCFAGDTVFGYVTGHLGYSFTGIELREEQVRLNAERTAQMPVKYFCDDGRNVLKYVKEKSQDLLFSCPPYFDLELYSDDPNDASNQETYSDFVQLLDKALTDSIKCLKENRFAVIVISDVRDENGFYRPIQDDIKAIFNKCGVGLYNEIVLIDAIGNAAMRASGQMKSRKVARTHQNVLVFFKGDPKTIKTNYPQIDYVNEGEDLELLSVDSGNE